MQSHMRVTSHGRVRASRSRWSPTARSKFSRDKSALVPAPAPSMSSRIAALFQAQLRDRSKPRVVVSPCRLVSLIPRSNATAWTASWSRVAKISAAETATPSTVIKTSLMTALASAESCRALRRSASEDAVSAHRARPIAFLDGDREGRKTVGAHAHGWNLATATSASGAKCQVESPPRGSGLGPMTNITGGVLMARADGVPALG